jgi:aspartate oxidase
VRPWDESRVSDSDEEVIIKQNWTEIRRFMWNYVGIVRTTKRLERAAHRIKMLFDEVEDYYGHFQDLLRPLQSADLIVKSALKRHESRGCTAPVIIRRRRRWRWTRFWCPEGQPRWRPMKISAIAPTIEASSPAP